MDNQKAIDAYIGAVGAIMCHLDSIKSYMDNEAFSENSPDEINWGHVGHLNHIESKLQEIVSELYPERNEA